MINANSASKFDARASGFVCPNASKVQLYCDAEDPYCCNGNDAAHHQQYVSIYGTQAKTFVNSKLGTTSGSSADDSSDTVGSDDSGDSGSDNSNTTCAALWGQCGGQSWTGTTCCSEGTCKALNQYYSQCS